jgi:aldehyde dehydrogenase (NAD+)
MDDIQKIFALHEANLLSAGNTNWKTRSAQLKVLEKTILSNRAQIAEALYQDFRKPASEVELSEIFVVLKEIRYARKNIRHWMRDERVRAHLGLIGTRSWITKESKGLALIISPWNFPFNLSMCAIVSAISAGCCVILKPSELTPRTNEVILNILKQVFANNQVAVVQGDASMSTELLKLPFNHIHFTGSPRVGKIVMKAAAENLSSVTLELGGKCPVVVDKSANIFQAAKRIAWAKTINAGQACIAPDFLVVHEEVKEQLVSALLDHFHQMYGSNFKDNIDYCGMINKTAADRMENLASSAKVKIEISAYAATNTQIIAPKIIEEIPSQSELLEDEIFGPLLPVRSFSTEQSLFSILNENSRPLASYIFSKNSRLTNKIIRNTRSGATCINEISIHFNNPNLPFGGSNGSGIGKSHGHFGYLEFTNQRAMLKQTFAWNTIHLITPPYSKFKKMISNLVVKYF